VLKLYDKDSRKLLVNTQRRNSYGECNHDRRCWWRTPTAQIPHSPRIL